VVDKLTPIVRLNSFDRKVELVLGVSKEADYMVAYIRFAFKWEQPSSISTR
jgi:hypothetical protein